MLVVVDLGVQPHKEAQAQALRAPLREARVHRLSAAELRADVDGWRRRIYDESQPAVVSGLLGSPPHA